MTVGTSLVLLAIGAILRFAVTVTAHGFNIQTVGLILMIVGAVGFVVSLAWMISASERFGRTPRGGRYPEDPTVPRY
jgi:hypothetical protein